MAQGIDVTVAAVIERDGRFLLVEELVSGRAVFNQPAGHLEPNESLIEAAIRETREETGHTFEPSHVVGIYQWHSEEAGTTFLRVAFCGPADAPAKPLPLDDGIIGFHFSLRPSSSAARANSAAPWCCAASTITSPASAIPSTSSRTSPPALRPRPPPAPENRDMFDFRRRSC